MNRQLSFTDPALKPSLSDEFRTVGFSTVALAVTAVNFTFEDHTEPRSIRLAEKFHRMIQKLSREARLCLFILASESEVK